MVVGKFVEEMVIRQELEQFRADLETEMVANQRKHRAGKALEMKGAIAAVESVMAALETGSIAGYLVVQSDALLFQESEVKS